MRKFVAHIVCGSPDLWLPENLCGFLIGVDRGALKLIEKGYQPNLAIGDFDSVNADEMKKIANHSLRLFRMDVIKDVTDCEAAVKQAVKVGCTQIKIYGATGGRFDHHMAVIGLMLKYTKSNISLVIIDQKNTIEILKAGNYHYLLAHQYISFFALEGTVKDLTVSGVKYPLKDYDLAVDDSLCVSNESLIGIVEVKFSSGYLLVIESSD